MKRCTIGLMIALLSVLMLLAACSKDKPTENESVSPIVGVWERTTTRADGVVMTPGNDTLNLIEDEIMTIRSDNTGQAVVDDQVFKFTWHLSEDKIVVKLEGESAYDVRYTLSGNTLTLFYPSDDGIVPDLEFTYTRM